jgi:hypothetical protein
VTGSTFDVTPRHQDVRRPGSARPGYRVALGVTTRERIDDLAGRLTELRDDSA